MSMTPTAGSATAKSSGRCSITAPTSRPPFEPPMMPSVCGEAYVSWTRYSAAAMKSSNTFCFFSNIPASCQASPYSLPPRMLAVTQTPPRSRNAGTSLPIRRQHRDVESAVAVQHRRIRPVFLEVLAVRDEHRHARAVLRGGEDALGRVAARDRTSASARSNGVLVPVAGSKRKTVSTDTAAT